MTALHPMHTLYISEYPENAPMVASTAVRNARRVLGVDDSLHAAHSTVGSLAAEGVPQLVGEHPELDVVREAHETLEATDGVVGLIDYSEDLVEVVPAAKAEEGREIASSDYQQALVFMMIAEGNPIKALLQVKALDEIRGDLSGVRAALLSAFVVPEDTDDGPIVVVPAS